MMRAKPGVTFWATIVVAVVLGYVLLSGPLCWASSRWGDGAIVTEVYRPLTRLLAAADSDALNRIFEWYSNLFARWDYGWVTSHPDGKHWIWMNHYEDVFWLNSEFPVKTRRGAE